MEPQLNESHSFFHSFCVMPKTKFESQGANEQVILLLRAHPITQIAWIFNAVVLSLLLFFLNVYFPLFISTQQILIFNLFSAVFIFSYAWFNILNWFYNVGIITNERIVDVDFSAIIYKEVNATRLNKVEDITSKSAGYFGSIFNYGDVFIQTAGAEKNIEFLKVPNPSRAVTIINGLLGH